MDVDPETDKLVYRLKDKQVTKAINTAGFFSSVSYKIEGGAAQQMALYALRDEQEKYFEEMKEQLEFSVQRNSSEDGSFYSPPTASLENVCGTMCGDGLGKYQRLHCNWRI